MSQTQVSGLVNVCLMPDIAFSFKRIIYPLIGAKHLPFHQTSPLKLFLEQI